MRILVGIALFTTVASASDRLMTEETWRSETQRELSVLRTFAPCCEDFREAPVAGKLSSQRLRVDITETLGKVRIQGEDSSPIVSFQVQPSSELRTVEFSSYSRKKTIFVTNLDRMFFIRPNVYFLDENYQIVAQHTDVAMCWDANSPVRLWARFVINDSRITRMVITSNLEVPYQSINVHALWAPPVIKAISEARSEYSNMKKTWFARTGRVDVRLIKNDKAAYGHCADSQAPVENKWW